MKSYKNSVKNILRTSKFVTLALLGATALDVQKDAMASPPRLPISQQSVSAVSDGRIAFESARSGRSQIYIMNADGSNQTQLTTYDDPEVTMGGIEPNITKDGNKIVFTALGLVSGKSEICSINSDGTGLTRLTENLFEEWTPTWSPDGTKVAFISDRDGDYDLYVMNADGSNQIKLTNNTYPDFGPATWSPDGSKIAYVSNRTGVEFFFSAYVINVDGTNDRRLFPNYIGLQELIAWSPDGSKMAFRGEENSIYTINIDGTNAKRLTTGRVVESWPTWSPDGTQIGFGGYYGGPFGYAFYKANADGTNLTKVTENNAQLWTPSWGQGKVQSATDAPLAYDQFENVYEDEPTPITLTGFDPKGGTLTYTLISQPSEGVLSGTAPNLIYTPDTDYDGPDSFFFKVNNGSKDSTIAKVSLYVQFKDDPPTISSIGNQVIDEDTETGELPFTVSNDSIFPSETYSRLTVTATSSNSILFPPSGITLGGSDAKRTIKLTPAPDAFGTAVITIDVAENGVSGTKTSFQVTVNSVEDAPEVSPLENQSLIEGQTTNNLPFTVRDAETSAESLIVSATSSNGNLVPASGIILGGTKGNRTIKVVPATNLKGSTNITVKVKEPGSNITTNRTFNVTVNAPNTAPTISNIANPTIKEDADATVLNFTIGDKESPSEKLKVLVTSSNQALIKPSSLILGGQGAQRTLTFKPTANAYGSAILTIKISDVGGLEVEKAVVVTVSSVNDVPTVSLISNQTIKEGLATGNISFTVGDIETPAANLVATVTSSNSKLFPNGGIALGGSGASRTLKLTPAAYENGTATITVKVTDGEKLSASSSFLITVQPVNDAPIIGAITDKTINEDSAPLGINFAVEDRDTPVANLVFTAKSSNQALFNASSFTFSGQGTQRTFTVKPLPNANGTATITVRATDGAGGITEKSFAITVKPINDAPTISLINNQSIKEGVATSALPFTIGDLETAAGSLAVTATSSNTKLFPANNIVLGGNTANRSIKLTPAALQSGNATITVQVKDSEGLITKSTFTVTVAKAS